MTGARWLVLLILLAACGSSPPSRFFTLDPVEPASGNAPARAGPAVSLGRVTLPAMLDRVALVTREGPNRIAVSDRDRWAAPLDGMIHRVLAADLARRLPGITVLPAGDPEQRGTRIVTLTIREFLGDTSGRVVLEADWAISPHGGPPGAIRFTRIVEEAGSGDGAAIAAAMSRALGALSGRIADGLQAATKPPP